MSQLEPGVLEAARYGKDKVRVFRVVRDPERKVHAVAEYNVTVVVKGTIETRCAHTPILPAPPNSSRTQIFLVLSLQLYARGQQRRSCETRVCPFFHSTTPPTFKVGLLINFRQYSEEHY